VVVKESLANRQALSWLLYGSSFISLFFWASLEDPFNAPKSWILYCVGLWLTGWVAFHVRGRLKHGLDRLVLCVSAALILCLTLDLIFTDVKPMGLLGDFGRSTGYLTYFFLVIFFIASVFLVTPENLQRVDKAVLVTGFLVALYGLLQHFHFDFIQWNNPYNSVLSTLGNPDFAAALMAIFLVCSVGLTLSRVESRKTRAWSLINSIGLLLAIVFSQALQGLLAAGLGIALILLIRLNQRSKTLTLFAAGAIAVAVAMGLLGMLDKGPLKGYLYKASVTYRGDYWRAGYHMFVSHFWFGVGLDRYGAYFREYRDATQALRRGPDLVSNAAHNVPLQIAATGGIFTLVAYMSITALILWRGVVSLRRTSGKDQILVATFFGAWLAYESQSLISVDNLGISIWGWILGGIVISLSKPLLSKEPDADYSHLPLKSRKNKRSASIVNRSSTSILQPFTSGVLLLVGLILVIPQYLEDTSLKTLKQYAIPTDSTRAAYLQIAKKPLGYGYADLHAQYVVGVSLVQAGAISQGKGELENLLARDPRSFDAMYSLALIDEQSGDLHEAIGIRRRIIRLDPWNYKNLLQLGEDLKKSGDFAGAKSILSQIDAYASHTAESATAHQDFGS
jgi:O-antigen ligase